MAIKFLQRVFSQPIIQLGFTVGLAFLFAPLLSQVDFSKLFGSTFYVIQSGSMEPSIMTGDLILIHSQSNYAKNDVITFIDESSRVVTHRINSVTASDSVAEFITKGDANPYQDFEIVLAANVLGKVALVIPKAGFIVSWGQTWQGIIILIIIPATALIFFEVMRE
ncbi:signal peptidase I [Patescibacteria group bacterium]|nr:signal peptidase I [Patescibacteria group bacterium]